MYCSTKCGASIGKRFVEISIGVCAGGLDIFGVDLEELVLADLDRALAAP